MAVLTEDRGERGANPYFDMDFYGDSRKSVFRPRYVIEQLQRDARFDYRPGMAVFQIESRAGGPPLVRARNIESGQVEEFEASKVILCANALNSARIVLNSVRTPLNRTSLLCNPYTYFPTINLGMLGRPASGRRHSLAQFGGVLLDESRRGIHGGYQLYSYRSLLLFKPGKEKQFPPALGLLVARPVAHSMAVLRN